MVTPIRHPASISPPIDMAEDQLTFFATHVYMSMCMCAAEDKGANEPDKVQSCMQIERTLYVSTHLVALRLWADEIWHIFDANHKDLALKVLKIPLQWRITFKSKIGHQTASNPSNLGFEDWLLHRFSRGIRFWGSRGPLPGQNRPKNRKTNISEPIFLICSWGY